MSKYTYTMFPEATKGFYEFDVISTVTVRWGAVLTPYRVNVVRMNPRRTRKIPAQATGRFLKAPHATPKPTNEKTEDEQWDDLARQAQTSWANENKF